METIFPKIIRSEIPCHKVYEDEHALAFLDIEPVAKGHTLVVPKVAAETIFDLPEAEAQALMTAVTKTMARIQAALHPDGFTVGWNHGRAGGQAVSYVHVHIFPRWYNDGGRSMHAVVANPGDMTVAEVAALFH